MKRPAKAPGQPYETTFPPIEMPLIKEEAVIPGWPFLCQPELAH
jgi:hypothetical protein